MLVRKISFLLFFDLTQMAFFFDSLQFGDVAQLENACRI